MKILIGLLIFAAVVMVYALWLRDWLKTQPWAAGFFALIEPIERVLYKKSETILWARLKIVTGVILSVLTYAGTIDLTPLMPFVPDKYEGIVRAAFNLLPLIISLVGMVDEKLRNQTTLPIEVVALPSMVAPDVAAAVIVAKMAATDAVAAVKDENAAPTPESAKVDKPDISTPPPKAGG